MTDQRLLFGILGGMGPQATLDLQQKLIDLMPAQTDQDHLPVVTWNVPQIPDRQRALAGVGVSPLPAILEGVVQLNRLGVSHILLPCNTAHHWYAELAYASQAPILNLIDVSINSVANLSQRPSRVGIIATEGTLAAGWYQQRLQALGITSVLPTAGELADLFVPGCYAVKRGEHQRAGLLLEQLAKRLVQRGADHLLLACTEVPIALTAIRSPLLELSTDPAIALAQHCVSVWQGATSDYLSDADITARN